MPTELSAVNVSLFDGLSAPEKETLYSTSDHRTYPDGAVIISEGEEGDSLFIVASGTVQVEKATLDRRQEALVLLQEGECFGELTIVDKQPRSATVRAVGDTEVYIFKRDALEQGFALAPNVHHRVLENLIKIMSGRLRRVDENLIQSIYDSVIVVDRNLKVMEWNRISDLRGIPAQELSTLQSTDHDLFKLMPHLQGTFQTRIEEVIESGEAARFLVDYENPGNCQIYLDTVVAPYKRGAQIVGAVLAQRDITDVKSLENQLIHAEKLAMSGQMAADIGHELNNYLSIISGHADLISIEPALKELPRALKSLGAILEQVRRIERFTANLMDFSAQNTQKNPTDLNGLISKLVQFIHPQHRFRNVAFDMHLQEDLPSLNIDSGQIQQVLLNLFANAADAVPSGKVTTTTEHNVETHKVLITVKDNGPGMPDKVLAKIFDTGFTTKRTGHGFGLPICKRIVENHGGEIAVISQVKDGTTFTIQLPVTGH